MKNHHMGTFMYGCIIMSLLHAVVTNASSKELKCGIATGFPPYQFQEKE